MDFEANCSEELAALTLGYIKMNDLHALPHMLLLDSHGVLINEGCNRK